VHLISIVKKKKKKKKTRRLASSAWHLMTSGHYITSSRQTSGSSTSRWRCCISQRGRISGHAIQSDHKPGRLFSHSLLYDWRCRGRISASAPPAPLSLSLACLSCSLPLSATALTLLTRISRNVLPLGGPLPPLCSARPLCLTSHCCSPLSYLFFPLPAIPL